MLGSGLGGIADALDGRRRAFPYAELDGFPQPSVAGHGGTLHLGELSGLPVAVFQGRKHVYEGGDPGAMRGPDPLAEGARRRGAAGHQRRRLACDADVGPGRLMAITDHINLLGVNPLTGPNDDAVGPRFPSLRDAYDPELRDRLQTRRRRAADRPRRGRLPRHRRPDASRPRPRSACSARSARTRSGCLPFPR